MDKLLDSVYYNTSSPACYAGIQAVYREAKNRDPNVKLSDVQEYLHKQHTYTVHKPIRRKFHRNKFIAFYVDSHWQADLCDLQALSKYNDGYKYLLTCCDVLSKFCWAIPVKNKQASTVRDAFAQILKTGRKCWWLFTDKGKEFIGKDFQDFVTKKRIIHVVSRSPDIKAANVERWNRTLKTRLWKYFTKRKTFRYLNVLQTLVQAINNSYTNTIGCRPIDVNQDNEAIIRERLFGKTSNVKTKPRFTFNVGDKVRIAKEKDTFKKGYLPNFTEEVFIVDERMPRQPIPVYRIKDLDGQQIEGVYYPAELVQAIPDDGPRRAVRYR